MNQSTKKESLYHFLEPVLEAGSETDIALARKKYWREYKANWRKQKRILQKEFTVSFTKKELQVIASRAKSHHRSRTKFIKDAALAYCTGKVLIPDPEIVNQIRELLFLNYTALQQRMEEAPTMLEKEATDILSRMEKLELQVLEMIQNPTTLNVSTIE